jgi:hypothetical protein
MFICPFGVRKFKINPIEIGSVAGAFANALVSNLTTVSLHLGLPKSPELYAAVLLT